jgi:hypothetical protein
MSASRKIDNGQAPVTQSYRSELYDTLIIGPAMSSNAVIAATLGPGFGPSQTSVPAIPHMLSARRRPAGVNPSD